MHTATQIPGAGDVKQAFVHFVMSLHAVAPTPVMGFTKHFMKSPIADQSTS